MNENEYYNAGKPKTWFRRNCIWLTAVLVVVAAIVALAVFWHSKAVYVREIRGKAVSSAPFHFGKQTAIAYLVPISTISNPKTVLPCGLGSGTVVYGDYNLVIVRQYFNSKHFHLPIYGTYTAVLPAMTFTNNISGAVFNDQLDVIHLNLSDRNTDEILVHQYDTCPQSRDILYGINPANNQLSAFTFIAKNASQSQQQSVMNLNNSAENNNIISAGQNLISTVQFSALKISGNQEFDHVTWKLDPNTNTFREDKRVTSNSPK